MMRSIVFLLILSQASATDDAAPAPAPAPAAGTNAADGTAAVASGGDGTAPAPAPGTDAADGSAAVASGGDGSAAVASGGDGTAAVASGGDGDVTGSDYGDHGDHGGSDYGGDHGGCVDADHYAGELPVADCAEGKDAGLCEDMKCDAATYCPETCGYCADQQQIMDDCANQDMGGSDYGDHGPSPGPAAGDFEETRPECKKMHEDMMNQEYTDPYEGMSNEEMMEMGEKMQKCEAACPMHRRLLARAKHMKHRRLFGNRRQLGDETGSDYGGDHGDEGEYDEAAALQKMCDGYACMQTEADCEMSLKMYSGDGGMDCMCDADVMAKMVAMNKASVEEGCEEGACKLDPTGVCMTAMVDYANAQKAAPACAKLYEQMMCGMPPDEAKCAEDAMAAQEAAMDTTTRRAALGVSSLLVLLGIAKF